MGIFFSASLISISFNPNSRENGEISVGICPSLKSSILASVQTLITFSIFSSASSFSSSTSPLIKTTSSFAAIRFAAIFSVGLIGIGSNSGSISNPGNLDTSSSIAARIVKLTGTFNSTITLLVILSFHSLFVWILI